MKKMTKEMQALAAQETEITSQVVILTMLGERAKELGANTEIREMLALMLERYWMLDHQLIEQLDALAAAQEARHE